MVCKKCLVGGRVQGVFYRATAARRAQELKIRGYARNLPDGRVEVLACGAEEAVNAFVSWLWIGSSASKVTSRGGGRRVARCAQCAHGFLDQLNWTACSIAKPPSRSLPLFC